MTDKMVSVAALLDAITPEQLKANWCISRETGQFLSWLASTIGVKTVLEVGTSIGYSGLWWLSALQSHTNGHLHTVDVNAERQQQAMARFAHAGLSDRVTLHTGEALEILSVLTIPPVDLMFLDARKSDYVHYFTCAKRLVRPGGLVIADNTTSHAEAMTDFFEAVKASGCPFTPLASLGSGLWLITCL